MASVPTEFFTLQSMLTLSGATGATVVVSNGFQRAFDFNPRWLALAVAEAIAIAGVVNIGGSGSDYFIGVVNGFLIYCTSAGAAALTGTPQPAPGVARGAANAGGGAPNRRGFRTRWF